MAFGAEVYIYGLGLGFQPHAQRLVMSTLHHVWNSYRSPKCQESLIQDAPRRYC